MARSNRDTNRCTLIADETRPLLRSAAVLAAYPVAGGLITLTGWFLDLPRLADWFDTGIAQMPNSAIAIILAAGAVVANLFDHKRTSRVLATISGVIAAATLLEHATGIDLGIDQAVVAREWGQRGTTAPGRMGIPGSTAILIGSMSIMAATFRRWQKLATGGGTAMIAITLLSIIGYAFGADPLYAVPRVTAIAPQTSTMLLALGAAILASNPASRAMRLMASDSSARILVRRALALVIIVPVVLGWLAVRAHAAGLFDTAFGTALLVLILIALLVALLWWSAMAIDARERAVQENRDRLAGLVASLSESENKWSLLFEKTPFATALSRSDGTFVSVNSAFAEMFGFSREEVVGKNSLELGINREDASRTDVMSRLDEEKQIWGRELELYTRSGERRVVLCNVAVIEIGGEQHILSSIQDITERKAAEEALRASSRALVAADRMKDEFLATLSHELRTPLTAIVGWSSLLLHGSMDKREQQTALEVIESSAKAQAQLIEDVLDVSRIITGKLRLERAETDLGTVIEAAAATVRPAAEAKGITLTISHQESLPLAFVDPDRIQQVVWNLLSNAIKFSPQRTTVEVRLRSAQGAAAIDVVDQGPGIAEEFLPQLFQRFRQADSSSSRLHGGLGIGLALSKDLVELHGGSISVRTRKGEGAAFTVHLPLARAAAPSGSAAPADITVAAALEGLRVLYVDDRADARLLVATMLEQHGAEVVEADSVGDALAVLSDASPHVVVTDLAMPARDGYDLLESLKSDDRWRQLPVVALTAQGRYDEEARAIGAGFRLFLRKPVEARELAIAIAKVAGDRPSAAP